MSKNIDRAKELLTRINELSVSFVLNEDGGIWDDEYIASDYVKEQYSDVLMDVRLLLFADSPEHPLYLKAKELVEKESGQYSDFKNLEGILLKYVEYRLFLEQDVQ